MTSESNIRPTVATQTLGCKVSQYESEAIAEAFERCGYEVRSFDEVCDVYIINTCTVTAESDRKSRQMIRRAIKKNPSAIVCVCGCYSQTSSDEVAKIEGVGVVIGTKDKLTLPTLVKEAVLRRASGNFSPIVQSDSLEGADFGSLVIQLLYLACACTAATLFLQNFGQKYAHPTGAAVILTFEAVFGALFSLLLGREEGFSFVRACGFVLVFLAVVISETKLSFMKPNQKINKTQ